VERGVILLFLCREIDLSPNPSPARRGEQFFSFLCREIDLSPSLSPARRGE
jgi:hypothetical protein